MIELLVWMGVVGLVAYRVWRMVAVDSIFDGWRGRLPQSGFWADLWSCPWCLGFWLCVIFAGVLGGVGEVGWIGAGLVALGASTIVGVIGRED